MRPLLVTLSVATAGSSGPIGSLQEAFAPVPRCVEAAKGNNELLRNVVDQRNSKTTSNPFTPRSRRPISSRCAESLQAMAADKAGKAVATLKVKGAAGDLDAYREFVCRTRR